MASRYFLCALACLALLSACGTRPAQVDFLAEATAAADRALANSGIPKTDFTIECRGAYLDSDEHLAEKCSSQDYPAGGGLEIWMRLTDAGSVETVTVSSDDVCQAGPEWVISMAKHYGTC